MGARTDERSAFWLPAALPGYEMFKARFRTHRYARHTHDQFGICVVESGAHRFHAEGRENIAPARSLIAINPGMPHDGRAFAEQGYAFRVLFVAPEALALAAADDPGGCPADPRFLRPVIEARHLADELAAIHRACEPGGDAEPLEAQARLTSVLAELAVRHGAAKPPRRRAGTENTRIAKARDWMLDRLDQPIDLTEAAREAGLSPFHFLRLFKAATGLPPHAWLTQARVARARDLLRRGTPLADTAVAVGFFDQPHFTRRFVAVTGLTPGQYRAAFSGAAKR
jgi:AraC-like DNA-binding protein